MKIVLSAYVTPTLAKVKRSKSMCMRVCIRVCVCMSVCMCVCECVQVCVCEGIFVYVSVIHMQTAIVLHTYE